MPKTISIVVGYYDVLDYFSFTDAVVHTPEFKELSILDKLSVMGAIRTLEKQHGHPFAVNEFYLVTLAFAEKRWFGKVRCAISRIDMS